MRRHHPAAQFFRNCEGTDDEAVQWVADGARFDVVLCDLSMPGMDGEDCFRRIEALAPEMAGSVVFLTGGALTPKLQQFEKSQSARVTYKPITQESIDRIVASVTAGLAMPAA